MTCPDCGSPLRRSNEPPDGRRRHAGRGLCRTCYHRRERRGTLPDRERRTAADWRADYDLLTSAGLTPAQVADRLGVTRWAVYKARTRLAYPHPGDEPVDGPPRNLTERLDTGLAPALD
jgi:hypothetical protein